mmetsp:Transcript_66464/g.188680  ORF Transcript_66464/g.188680 Transcript_66464/m.188680 type:complete len:498 (-) Transcript_66464:321-1814(-)
MPRLPTWIQTSLEWKRLTRWRSTRKPTRSGLPGACRLAVKRAAQAGKPTWRHFARTTRGDRTWKPWQSLDVTPCPSSCGKKTPARCLCTIELAKSRPIAIKFHKRHYTWLMGNVAAKMVEQAERGVLSNRRGGGPKTRSMCSARVASSAQGSGLAPSIALPTDQGSGIQSTRTSKRSRSPTVHSSSAGGSWVKISENVQSPEADDHRDGDGEQAEEKQRDFSSRAAMKEQARRTANGFVWKCPECDYVIHQGSVKSLQRSRRQHLEDVHRDDKRLLMQSSARRPLLSRIRLPETGETVVRKRHICDTVLIDDGDGYKETRMTPAWKAHFTTHHPGVEGRQRYAQTEARQIAARNRGILRRNKCSADQIMTIITGGTDHVLRVWRGEFPSFSKVGRTLYACAKCRIVRPWSEIKRRPCVHSDTRGKGIFGRARREADPSVKADIERRAAFACGAPLHHFHEFNGVEMEEDNAEGQADQTTTARPSTRTRTRMTSRRND